MGDSIHSLLDLLVDTGSDAWPTDMEPPQLDMILELLLCNNQHGNLDGDTIQLLIASGVHDGKSFVRFTLTPFSKFFKTLSNAELVGLPKKGLCYAQIFGHFVSENNMLGADRAIHDENFNWNNYYKYWRNLWRHIGLSYDEALRSELKTHLAVAVRHGRGSSPSRTSSPSVIKTPSTPTSMVGPTSRGAQVAITPMPKAQPYTAPSYHLQRGHT